MLRDLHDALRSISGSRGVSLIAVLTLTLGIGVNSALFSVVDALLFRPLPVQEPHRLVRFFTTERRGGVPAGRVSYPLYTAYRDALRGVRGVMAFREGVSVALALERAAPESASVSLVSGNYFEVLGLRAPLGRLIAPDDDQGGRSQPVAVLSHRFWQRRFASSTHSIGSEIRVNGHAFTVVGVAPRGFAGIALEQPPDLFLPITVAAPIDPILKTQYQLRSNPFFEVAARLGDGQSVQQAQSQLDTLGARIGAGSPALEGPEAGSDWRQPWLGLRLAQASVSRNGTALARLLMGVVALVLAIACIDAAVILVARAERRRKEIAMRAALGAPAARIARVLVLEGLLLSGMAAIGGVLMASWSTARLLAALPSEVPLPMAAASDVLSGRVLAATAALAFGTGLAFSLIPALSASRVDLVTALKAGPARAPRSGLPVRSTLVALQVGMCCVLLVGSGLLLRTLHNAISVDPGFDPHGVVVASVNLARGGHDMATAAALLSPLRDSVAAIPGVRSSALGMRLPLQQTPTTTVSVDGREHIVGWTLVGPGYTDTLGLRLLRGRDLRATDAAGRPYVGLVNELLAERLWPGQDALGKRIDDFSPKQASIEVVGVLRARAGSPRHEPAPLLVLPYAQMYDAFPWHPNVGIIARSADVRGVLLALPAAVATVDPDLLVLGARTAGDELSLAFAQERLLAWLFTGFGMLALALALAGVFGLVAYTTEGRTREFGVRAALGARPKDLMAIVAGEAMRLVGAGLGVGLVGALVVGRGLRGYLFGIGTASPLVFGGTAALLALAAVAAAYAPARRAAAVDPITALRAE